MDEQKEQEAKIREINERNREYIKKLVAEGKLPEPRPLKRKERKALDESNLHIWKIKKTDERAFTDIKEAMCDWILDNIYEGFDFSDVDDGTANYFAMYTFGLSYRDELAEKNL